MELYTPCCEDATLESLQGEVSLSGTQRCTGVSVHTDSQVKTDGHTVRWSWRDYSHTLTFKYRLLSFEQRETRPVTRASPRSSLQFSTKNKHLSRKIIIWSFCPSITFLSSYIWRMRQLVRSLGNQKSK